MRAGDEALRALGGIPNPAEERWLGLALMARTPIPKAELEATAGAEEAAGDLSLPQQAGIRCEEGRFWEFLIDAGHLIHTVSFPDPSKAKH